MKCRIPPLLYPNRTISPIVEGISIGGLLSYSVLADLQEFGFILNVARELAGDEPEFVNTSRGAQRVLHGRLDDDDDVGRQVFEIDRLVRLVSEARARDLRVLVTCAEGRNRSALVVAEHLIRHWVEDADEVIAHMRNARARALTNESFVGWLRRLR